MLPGTVFAAPLRSPYPHARIASERRGYAEGRGRRCCFQRSKLAEDWKGGLQLRLAGDRGHQDPGCTSACRGRGAGRRRAVVIAESRALAKDAAELVEVEYEPLPSVADVEKALEDGAPLVHAELGTNECYVWEARDR